MQNLISLILIGLFIYLIFFRKGGMGCCGGRRSHEPERHQVYHSNPGDLPHDRMEKVIDLRKDEYTIISSRNDQDHTRT